jgi:hypothetical protein
LDGILKFAVVRLGILADTHVPDRARSLQPKILEVFRQAGVQTILHAGDISVASVLAELEQVAPVYAVRGNRDWFHLRHLPETRYLNFEGVPIVLTHGHGGWLGYLVDKYQFMRDGYRLERYQPRLQAAFPQARLIVFGHTHNALNLWSDGQLLFNPGSAHFHEKQNEAPSLGIITIEGGGKINAELIALERPVIATGQGS